MTATVALTPYDVKQLIDLIRHCDRWLSEQGIAMYHGGKYPRIDVTAKFANDRAHYQAWHVDALMSCAYYLRDSQTRPHEFIIALRCYAQACEYKGRCQDQLSDSSWYDEHLRIRCMFDCVIGTAFGGGLSR